MFLRKEEDKKVFLIVNSYFVGDILLVSPMIQTIKRLYPESVVLMVTSEALQDVAKYQTGVDDVIIWDRKGKDKGITGMFKFLKRLPYKKIYTAFAIYGMDRPAVLCKMTNPKYLIGEKRKGLISFLFKSKYKFELEESSVQKRFINLLRGITKEELYDVPMSYEIPEGTELKTDCKTPYIVICPVTSNLTKDIPLETVSDIISKINMPVVLVGHGNVIKQYSEFLKDKNYQNLIDLTNQTSIPEVANVIKNAKGMISADTGLMHLACAVDTPVVSVFYIDYKSGYMPDEKLYRAKILTKDQNAENIIYELNNLLDK